MREITVWVRRLQALLRRREFEREMDEEMRLHVELEAEDLVRRHGLMPAEARRRALVAFGGVERYKAEGRDVKGISLLENLWRDVSLSTRRLWREPGFSLPMLASVALGIGVTLSAYALVSAVLLRPLPYPEPDGLVALTHAAAGREIPRGELSLGTFRHYQQNSRAFEAIGVYLERFGAVTSGEGAGEQVRTADVSAGVFTILRARPHLGRLLTEADAVPGSDSQVVISHELWTRRYGADPNIIGRRIELQRSESTVVGVMEPGFGFPHPETHVWYSSWKPLSPPSGGGFFLRGIGRLRSGVSLEAAEADLDRLVRSLPEAYPDLSEQRIGEIGLRANARPLQEAMTGDVRTPLRLLGGMAAFLLLATWANATNLCLARGERQRRETSVARALGAGELHVVRRCVAEGVVLSAIAAALGLALGWVAVQARLGFEPDQIPRLRELRIGDAEILLVLGLAAASAALVSAVSYLSVRRAEIGQLLRGAIGRTTTAGRDQLARRLVIVGQFAIALTLLTGAGLMATSFWRMSQLQLGFEPEGAISFYLPTPPAAYGENYYHEQVRIHDEILRRLREIPGVEAAEAANIAAFPLTPVQSFYRVPVRALNSGAPDDAPPSAFFAFATPGYFTAMQIPMVQGRTFRPEDTGREGHGVVISSSLATALFGDGDPLGRSVSFNGAVTGAEFRVVGVAGDVPAEGVREGPSPVLYLPNLNPPRADTITGVVHIYVPSNEVYVVRTGLPTSTVIAAAREAIREVDPELVMTDVRTLEELVADDAAQTRLAMWLLLLGSGTAVLLGGVGIYGLLAYTVARRTSEIGIRIAVGADPRRIVRMLVRQGLVLGGLGIVLGLFAAAALTGFLEGLLYEVRPLEPSVFIATTGLLVLFAIGTSYLPARRAGEIDPSTALKTY